MGPAYPFRGGIVNFNETLAGYLQKEGHEVEILSFSMQYPAILFPGKTQKDTSSSPQENLVIHSKIHSLNPLNWSSCARFIQQFSPDLIILQFWIPYIALSFGQILSRAGKQKPKTIAICHNVIPHETHPGARCLTKSLLKKCDAYVVLSESVLADLDTLKLTGPRIYHPHPLYDMYGPGVEKVTAAEHFKMDPEGKYLLFFGLIREYKGLDITLKAMGDERVKELGIKLIVAGEFYEKEKKYMQIIQDLGLQDDVIFIREYIPKHEVGYYFGLADMVVQTYKTATQSGVTQVAYHFEKPMLVTNVGGLAEIVPNGRVGYVTEKDPRAVSDAIVDFYENDREKEFAPHLKEEKKRFSWESFVQRMLEMSSL